MVVHLCPKCGQKFDKKDSLNKHLKQKISCDSPLRKFDCLNEFCPQKFTSRQNRHVHMKTCKPKQLVDDIKKDNQLLRQALDCVGGNVQNLNIDQSTNIDQLNQNIDQSITLNVHVNCFGQENKDYIQKMTLDSIKQLLSNKEEDEALRDYVKLLRMNPEHPENHNIRIPDENGNIMMKRTGKGWSNVEAEPNGLWSVTAVDFFDLKDLAKRLFRTGDCGDIVDWIGETEKKINTSSYKNAGLLIDIMRKLKTDFSEFTRLVYLEKAEAQRFN